MTNSWIFSEKKIRTVGNVFKEAHFRRFENETGSSGDLISVVGEKRNRAGRNFSFTFAICLHVKFIRLWKGAASFWKVLRCNKSAIKSVYNVIYRVFLTWKRHNREGGCFWINREWRTKFFRSGPRSRENRVSKVIKYTRAKAIFFHSVYFLKNEALNEKMLFYYFLW